MPVAAKWTEQSLQQLRVARHAGNGAALVALLASHPLTEVLQTAGDAVGDAATGKVPGAAELAGRSAAALRARGWEGDADLAQQLHAALSAGTRPLLRPLPVDLEELSDMLEGDPLYGGGRIDLITGQCDPQRLIDSDAHDEDPDEAPDRWLPVRCEGSREGYLDMELFITTIDDAALVDRLTIAVSGRGAFRRFKDVLAERPEEQRRFYVFSEERRRGRARSWLAARGYRPATCPR